MTGESGGRDRPHAPERVREPDPVGEPEIVVFDSPAALANAACDRVTAALEAAVRERGVAHFVLTGGSSPVALYRLLAERRDVPWADVHLWWGDDRLVPSDHPESNAGLVEDTLLRADEEKTRGAPVPADNVHPFPVLDGLGRGDDGTWIAATYAEEMLRHVPSPDGRPIVDLMLLGVGPDGHVLSVFPGSPALGPDAPLALAVPAPEHVAPHLARVTLRASVTRDARALLVLVPDGAKAPIAARALEGPRDQVAVPAVIARRRGATWMLTRESAAGLRRTA